MKDEDIPLPRIPSAHPEFVEGRKDEANQCGVIKKRSFKIVQKAQARLRLKSG